MLSIQSQNNPPCFPFRRLGASSQNYTVVTGDPLGHAKVVSSSHKFQCFNAGGMGGVENTIPPPRGPPGGRQVRAVAQVPSGLARRKSSSVCLSVFAAYSSERPWYSPSCACPPPSPASLLARRWLKFLPTLRFAAYEIGSDFRSVLTSPAAVLPLSRRQVRRLRRASSPTTRRASSRAREIPTSRPAPCLWPDHFVCHATWVDSCIYLGDNNRWRSGTGADVVMAYTHRIRDQLLRT